MSDPARLAELRRQRALIQEHLAWLDREIAGQEPIVVNPPAITAPLVAAQPTPTLVETRPPAISTPAIDAEAESAMEKFRASPSDIQRDVRKGCLIYTAVGFVLFAAAVVGLYYALRH